MKVKELMKKLNKLDPESEVYLLKDPEGNGFNKPYYVDGNCVYYNEDIYSLSWSASDACLEEDEWDRLKSQIKCVVISP